MLHLNVLFLKALFMKYIMHMPDLLLLKNNQKSIRNSLKRDVFVKPPAEDGCNESLPRKLNVFTDLMMHPSLMWYDRVRKFILSCKGKV